MRLLESYLLYLVDLLIVGDLSVLHKSITQSCSNISTYAIKQLTGSPIVFKFSFQSVHILMFSNSHFNLLISSCFHSLISIFVNMIFNISGILIHFSITKHTILYFQKNKHDKRCYSVNKLYLLSISIFNFLQNNSWKQQ